MCGTLSLIWVWVWRHKDLILFLPLLILGSRRVGVKLEQYMILRMICYLSEPSYELELGAERLRKLTAEGSIHF